METKIIEKTTGAAFRLGDLTNEVSRAGMFVNGIIDDGKRKAQRTAKRAVVAAEECVEETTSYIKRHPWQSVGLAAGVGVGAGLLASWMLASADRACTRNGKAQFQAVER